MKSILSLLAVVALISQPLSGDDGKPAARAPGKGDPSIRVVSPDEAQKLIKEVPGLTVLDVRTPDEFAAGHIKGARNVDFLDADFEKQVAALDATKPVLIHCASGNRSSRALAQMNAQAKFPAVYHLKSGFSGWKAAGKPIEIKQNTR
jgi:rhodanese-related sulfurtransferase